MMTAAPRRAELCCECPGGYALHDAGHDRLPREALPRRSSRPQRAVHCLTTHTCMGCPDDEHQRTWAEFEQAPRRAASDWEAAA